METLSQYRGLENELRKQRFYKIVARSAWIAPQEFYTLDADDAQDTARELREEQYLVETFKPGEW